MLWMDICELYIWMTCVSLCVVSSATYTLWRLFRYTWSSGTDHVTTSPEQRGASQLVLIKDSCRSLNDAAVDLECSRMIHLPQGKLGVFIFIDDGGGLFSLFQFASVSDRLNKTMLNVIKLAERNQFHYLCTVYAGAICRYLSRPEHRRKQTRIKPANLCTAARNG